ncbi:MAG TPA: SUF system Fe-S cluster assembly regulator [Xanthomonadales bacterium]|nr:SUF system Fe-S cluster assembly regulator [Xanthomonadales bacterium]
MLRISKLTDYATVVMTALAEADDPVMSAQGVAERARLEPPTVSKVLKLLAQAGLVESFRGVHGGYRLARAAGEITVADIVAAIEGPFGMTECSVHKGQCDYEPHCGVRGNWRRISLAIEGALRSVTLADMRAPRARKAIPLRVLEASA